MNGRPLLATSWQAPWDKALSRYVTRTENSGERLYLSLDAAFDLWLWVFLSGGTFLLLTLFFALLDSQAVAKLRGGPSVVAAYFHLGARTLLATFRDRQTPHWVRLIVVAGLLYWLLPSDILADVSTVPGFVDDIAVAVLCAKLFVHYCPDGVLAKHASRLARD